MHSMFTGLKILVSIPASHSVSPGFNSQSRNWLSRGFSWFSSPFPSRCYDSALNRPQLLPFSSISVHFTTMLQF